MSRQIHRLTALKVQRIKQPGSYGDGNGLTLIVRSGGSKQWVWRGRIRGEGRVRTFGLGSARLVTLADARLVALGYTKAARSGLDPRAENRPQHVATFEQMAEQVIVDQRGTWRNERSEKQWRSSLRAYAFPVIGSKPVNQVTSSDVIEICAPIWATKRETATRVFKRIATIMDRAVAGGLIAVNPTARAALTLKNKGAKKQVIAHASLPWASVPQFVRVLQHSDTSASTGLCLQFAILTACRSIEARKAIWSEIDLQQRIWTISGTRMKAGKEHRVPLSDQALEVLTLARRLNRGPTDLIFPGRNLRTTQSDNTLSSVVKRLGFPGTVHGFRASFRTWTSETTDFPEEIAEAALAHAVSNAVVKAYRRTDFFDKRRVLLTQWGQYVASKPQQRGTQVKEIAA